jgi:outer membrane biosynthesis protein TonB
MKFKYLISMLVISSLMLGSIPVMAATSDSNQSKKETPKSTSTKKSTAKTSKKTTEKKTPAKNTTKKTTPKPKTEKKEKKPAAKSVPKKTTTKSTTTKPKAPKTTKTVPKKATPKKAKSPKSSPKIQPVAVPMADTGGVLSTLEDSESDGLIGDEYGPEIIKNGLLQLPKYWIDRLPAIDYEFEKAPEHLTQNSNQTASFQDPQSGEKALVGGAAGVSMIALATAIKRLNA